MVIEIATTSDIPALAGLLATLFNQEKEFKPNLEAHKRGLARIIEAPNIGAVLVARLNDRIVGMVNLLFTISTALGEPVALLEDMVVLAHARGNGIGTALITAAISFAKQHGYQRITLLTDNDNFAAQRFYVKQGFSISRMMPMRLSLE